MNTMTNFANQPVKHPEDFVLTLDHGKNEDAFAGKRISASPRPTNLVSGLASSVWNGSWALHGIPELDSPLAD